MISIGGISRRGLVGRVLGLAASAGVGLGAPPFHDPNVDRQAMPTVPPGFEVTLFAGEPMIRQPCSLTFDARGRMLVGMGPQYRNPRPDTPGDSVVLVLDTDGDGRADRTQVFATGFNAIQSLAWRGRDLWVANAPDLTVVRDLDGDDVADEYVRVYTDLGNLEHGVHGLNWAPDGWLYLTKGNSKGLTQPGRVAPKPFRDLWGVPAPPGTPDFPPPRTFRRGEYRRAYHDPEDDWGREGGVLRCEDGGRNLEIVARGCRNPWDMAADDGMNWLASDNDQTGGDRVFMPFAGAHFGWNHPWSAEWGDAPAGPAAPVSGPLYEGSGTGVVFGDSPTFPASHRGVFFINDWLRKTTFLWRPAWDGALMRPDGGDWQPFVVGGRALFRPTGAGFGPDGALWILGWSTGYGAEYWEGQMVNEGRIFRVQARPAAAPLPARRPEPLARWTVPQLVADLAGPVSAWRIDAQDELVRRGPAVLPALQEALAGKNLTRGQETWVVWTLGRLGSGPAGLAGWMAARVADAGASLNLRVQAIRILADWTRRAGPPATLPAPVLESLRAPEPRLRFEAVQALRAAGARPARAALLDLLAAETDRTTFYAGWQALRGLATPAELKELLPARSAGVRRAAFLALAEDEQMGAPEAARLASDPDPTVQAVARRWQEKTAVASRPEIRGRGLDGSVAVKGALPEGARLVKNLRTRTGAGAKLVEGGLRPGARAYHDRAYPLREVPARLAGLDYLQLANDDDGSHGEDWLTFEVVAPVRVHVAVDTRLPRPPAWLGRGFAATPLRIVADHWTNQVYTREFPAGPVRLGGNTDDGHVGGHGHYLVVLEPLPRPAPAAPTALEPVMAGLSSASAERGRFLFHHPSGAGCSQCHRLEDHGQSFGPDLGTVGDRATAAHLVQSMLEPNAVITEGFQLQVVETAEGEFSGVLLEESGLMLTLGVATGERLALPKKSILKRETAPGSAMPAFAAQLGTAEVADLTAYLLSRRAGPGGAGAGPAPGAGEPWRVEERPDRLVIRRGEAPVAEFVFRDERIRRPYLANLHAPGGVQVTRHHPPRATDAPDHDTMHPGVWLGFGDLNGTDFWRNKARWEHGRFLGETAATADRLRFATEGSLVDPAGVRLGAVTNRLSLRAIPAGWLVIWEADLTAGPGGLVFGDQEEMGFGARVATPLTEKAGGRIVSSTGEATAEKTWGQAFDWCDYSGVTGGRRAGLQLMGDPGNFRRSWWHNRNYGVFVANPFGREAMKQGPRSTVTVRPGETLRLRFGAVAHADAGGVDFDPADAYRRFVAEGGSRP